MISINFSWKDAPTSRIVHLIQVALQFLAAIIVIGLNASDIEAGPTNTGVSVSASKLIATLGRRLTRSVNRSTPSSSAPCQQ
jgi:hypothetical protein